MCYSALVWADYRQYLRELGAFITVQEFVKLFKRRADDRRIKIPKGMEAAFRDAAGDEGLQIKAVIDAYNAEEATRLQQELFKQRARLADAERKLQTKPTKTAEESRRIAQDKIEWTVRKLADLNRTDARDADVRIFPGHFAPVMVMQEGKRVVLPMRYQCRLAGKPASYDVRYPGTYNARRDNLEGFWKQAFGHQHGIMVVNAFYENVSRHKVERRELGPDEVEENVVLEFKPTPRQDMYVACLWSRWSAPGEEDLLSFAAITDDPPPEVAAAGHDRCIIPIKPESIDAWLNPDPQNLQRQYEILDDRARPYYEHQLAA